jgi:hypothetical protein
MPRRRQLLRHGERVPRAPRECKRDERRLEGAQPHDHLPAAATPADAALPAAAAAGSGHLLGPRERAVGVAADRGGAREVCVDRFVGGHALLLHV